MHYLTPEQIAALLGLTLYEVRNIIANATEEGSLTDENRQGDAWDDEALILCVYRAERATPQIRTFKDRAAEAVNEAFRRGLRPPGWKDK